MNIIFNSSKGAVRKIDIENTLFELGISEGDELFVHSCLYTFGKLGEIKTKEELAGCFIESLINCIGPRGTLIVPTFTFSFCKTGVFDSESTKSEAGLLSEVLRKRDDAERSKHPIYSVAAWGKNKEYYLSSDNTTCFGEDGIFGRVHKNGKVKLLFIGIGAEGLSQIHYIEELLHVPYRYMKIFTGKADGKEVQVRFYVRDLKNNAELDMKGKTAEFCTNTGIIKTKALGESSISVIEENQLHAEMMQKMKEDHNFFLKQPYKGAAT